MFLIPLPLSPEKLKAQTHQTQSSSLLGIWESNPEIPLSCEPLPQPRVEDYFFLKYTLHYAVLISSPVTIRFHIIIMNSFIQKRDIIVMN